jgi:hypothetical protein
VIYELARRSVLGRRRAAYVGDKLGIQLVVHWQAGAVVTTGVDRDCQVEPAMQSRDRCG